MKTRLLCVAVGALFTTVFACAEPAPPSDTSAEPAIESNSSVALLDRLSDEQLEGRALYQSVCWTCHGAAGRGDGPAVVAGTTTGQPPNFIADGYAELTTDELLTRFDAALSGDGVDPEHPHMQHVVDLIRPERFRAALSYVPALAYPGDLPGSALAGMDLYQARCTACHGDAGDGEGYAATALVTRPADFRTDTLVAAGDYPGLFARIRDGGRSVHGSSMPAWGVALTDAQIWDLVAYVATFQDRSSSALPGGGAEPRASRTASTNSPVE